MLSQSEILSVFIILALLHFRVSLTAPVSPSPCTDFYEYACSSAKEHLENIGISSIWEEADDYNEKLLYSALSSGRARHTSASRAVSFLVDLYRKWESDNWYYPDSDIGEIEQSLRKIFVFFHGDSVSSQFHYVLSRVYVDAAIAVTSRKHIEKLQESSLQIAEKVKDAMGRLLGSKDLLSKESLLNLTTHAGYESWYMNDTALDAWYGLTDSSAFQFKHSASFQENCRAWRSETGKFTRIFAGYPVGESSPWAFYGGWVNQGIFLPLGYLFPAVFQHNSSHAATYGTIGASTGHELLHPLELSENPSFKEVTQCLIEQYSAIREPQTGLHLPGSQTITEDIADNGAIKAAFDAYRIAAEGTATPDTDRQFFLSFARKFCNIDPPEMLRTKIKIDDHSLSKYRVNVVLSNFEQFSQTFSCPIGSPMNPAKKCTVW